MNLTPALCRPASGDAPQVRMPPAPPTLAARPRFLPWDVPGARGRAPRARRGLLGCPSNLRHAAPLFLIALPPRAATALPPLRLPAAGRHSTTSQTQRRTRSTSPATPPPTLGFTPHRHVVLTPPHPTSPPAQTHVYWIVEVAALPAHRCRRTLCSPTCRRRRHTAPASTVTREIHGRPRLTTLIRGRTWAASGARGRSKPI